MKNNEIPKETIKVGSLVELLSDTISEAAEEAGWKMGDIAEVIKVDSSKIPYKLKIGETTSWACADHVRVYNPTYVRQISEETYQDLLETERKYLLLLEELKNLSKSLESYQETLENFYFSGKV